MHTPRLCIDGRAASELSPQGFMAQEVIDQMVMASDEPHASEWFAKKRAVLLTHPDQIFTGQLRRYDTKTKLGNLFYYQAWEKHFVESANISAFHRFRPADRLKPDLSCPVITTVLPERGGFSLSHKSSANHRYVVPSHQDGQILQSKYSIEEDRIAVVRPAVRRFVGFAESFERSDSGDLLFLVGKKTLDVRRLMRIVGERFPGVSQSTISLSHSQSFKTEQWLKILEQTTMCFYLTDQPFDWPFLALEAIYFGIPVVYMDKHHSLKEMLPESGLRLSRFLIETVSKNWCQTELKLAQSRLKKCGAFDTYSLAKQYRDVYEKIDINE